MEFRESAEIKSAQEVRKLNITNAQKDISTLINGKVVKQNIFKNDDEKSRASEIVKQLKGMSIREAQHFLSKVSEALIDSQML